MEPPALWGLWKSRNRYAYVFYATNDTYAIAVLVFVRLLRRLGIRDDVDIVVLHLRLSRSIVAKMRKLGMVTLMVPELGRGHHRHYKDCFVKLRSFQLSDYDRVVYVDADAVPLKSLDDLLALPFDGAVAAPSAYWLPQPSWTSALMVVRPSRAHWNRVKRSLALASEKRSNDMDFVNREFGAEIRTLPRDVFCLNSEWEDVDQPTFFGDFVETYSNVSVVHFTALGKPWSYSLDEVRQLRPNAHPSFYELWDTWRRARDEVLSDPPLGRSVVSVVRSLPAGSLSSVMGSVKATPAGVPRRFLADADSASLPRDATPKRQTTISRDELSRRVRLFRLFRVDTQYEMDNIVVPVVIQDEYQIGTRRFDQADVIIDVGAHIEAFAYLCYTLGSRAIYCYEPAKRNFELLERNLGFLPGVHLSHAAVWRSDRDGPTELLLSGADGENTGTHSVLAAGRLVNFRTQTLFDPPGQGERVAVVSLDATLGRFDRVKVLKLD
jgi:FkbM family methyltransferase